MIAIPLPFVVALLLTVLLVLVAAQGESGRRPVLVFLGACIALLIVVGLRWSLDAAIFRFLQPVIAALLPPTAWLCFAGLRGSVQGPVWPHALPPATVLVLSALWPVFHSPIDTLLVVQFFGYGALLMRRGLAGADSLAGARLGEAVQSGRAAVLAGGLLVLSGLVDLAIAMDFGLGDGGHARAIVSAGNLMVLPLIAWGVVVMGRGLPRAEAAPAAETAAEQAAADDRDLPTADDDQVMAAVERILSERRLYRDPDLTLERLARRVGIPGRQVSRAINRKCGQNVSQTINEWRIREAMELLIQTDRPVTAIMFDCGFQTKSNFNREFRRVAGTSPSDWRRRAAAAPGAPVDASVSAPAGSRPESR